MAVRGGVEKNSQTTKPAPTRRAALWYRRMEQTTSTLCTTTVLPGPTVASVIPPVGGRHTIINMYRREPPGLLQCAVGAGHEACDKKSNSGSSARGKNISPVGYRAEEGDFLVD